MKYNQIEKMLKNEIPEGLIKPLFEHFQKANNEFLKENWDYVGNEIGKFIEIAFRIVQNKNLEQYTPINEKLPTITEGFLKVFEQSNNVGEEYRIIIPRALYTMYCIRNKRGMIHINNINPNRMDALYLINSSKWILSEIIRLTSNIDFEIAMKIIDDILHKTIPYIWRNNDIVRVLNTKLNIKEKILILLYSEDKMSVERLFNCIEYKNKTIFKKYILELHKSRFLELDSNEECLILPNGIEYIEQILKRDSIK